jgi:tetratricopeptide (TPR) repeat protein
MTSSQVRAVLFAALAGASAPAWADTPAWSVGVTDAQKAQAQAALEQGNALFLDKKYAEAMEKYKSAVASWDHPAIRFNIVRCLIQLDRPVDASDNLKLALKYGAAPLEEAVYTEALAYEKLLANQIASVQVTCKQAGVKMTLDGQPLATCPAEELRRVTPGTHQLVGSKEGFLTRSIEVVVIGGKEQKVTLSLDPVEKAARIEHRWPGWVPWVVFGGGFAVTGIGGLLNLAAAQEMDSYDRAVAQSCATMACGPDDLDDADEALKGSAETKSAWAVGIMIAGGATIATGAVMLYLNRGRTVYPSSVERITPTVTPMPGGAALSFSGRF